MEYMAISAISGCIAAGCAYLAYKDRRQISEMDMPTTRVKDLDLLPANTRIEIVGIARAKSPLISKYTQKSCIFFSSNTEDTSEWYEDNSSGKRERRERTILRESYTDATDFLLDDGSGTVLVRCENASFEPKEFMRIKHIAPNSSNLETLIASNLLSVQRLIYSTKYEQGIEDGSQVYILGTLTSQREVAHPSEPFTGPLIISTKTEDERRVSLNTSFKWLSSISAISLFIFGWSLMMGLSKREIPFL